MTSRSLIFGGERKELWAYIREIADRMGLCAWYFEFGERHEVPADNHQYDRSDGMAGASIFVAHGSIRADLIIHASWPEWEPYLLRQMVVHELMHCHMAKVRWSVNNVQAVVGSKAMFELIESAYDDAEEQVVDAVAMAWAHAFPLPKRRKVT